jgi:xanthine dehydrogenase small subunit
MRTATSSLELHRPKTIHDALKMLRDDPTLVPMAGCTDLYVGVNFGTLTGTKFLDLWPLERLKKIQLKDDVLEIGALATYTDIIKSRAVKKQLPMLIESARQIGGPQIQNRGTIGGNIANASPAGDSLPVLAAATAKAFVAQTSLFSRSRFPSRRASSGSGKSARARRRRSARS